MDSLAEWLGRAPLVEPVGLAVLWSTALYLLLLGVSVFAVPRRARDFLAGFAQGTTVNLIEAALRTMVGLAFIGASGRTRHPGVALAIGMFLIGSAILLALLPRLHRQFAAQATRSVFRIFRLFGFASVALAALLAWFITTRHGLSGDFVD